MSTPPAGLSLNVERVEDRLDPRVVAVRVVVGGALAEVAQPAGRAPACTGGGTRAPAAALTSASRPLRNAGVATRWSDGILRVASVRSLSGAVAPEQRAQVADRRPRAGDERAQLAQERREVLRRRLGLGDEHVEVVERRAQVDERRVGAPQRRRQQAERLRQRDVLRADRPRGRVRVADEAGEVVAPLGQRGDEPRRVDDEARQRVLVLGDLADEPARRRQQRVEVLRRLARLLALAAVLRGEALDDVLQVAARLLVERVEDLVEVDDRRRRRGRQRRAVRRAPRRPPAPGVSAM